MDAVAQIAVNAGLSTLGFESRCTSYSQWESLATAVKPLMLIPVADQVEALRVVKDADEIAQIPEAIHQAERGYELLRASLRAEMSELQAANELEHAMRSFGARQSSFEIIVAAGPRAALPHARPTSNCVGTSDFVLVDWGATGPRGLSE